VEERHSVDEEVSLGPALGSNSTDGSYRHVLAVLLNRERHEVASGVERPVDELAESSL
jgi:hypothetical protein